jgi:hypothetical protein
MTQRAMGGLWMGVLILFLSAATAHGQQTVHNNFEANKTYWVPGPADAANEVIEHINTDKKGAHNGQRSEYLKLNAQAGKFIYYLYPIGKAPLTEELNGRVWLKADRPGLQLLARIILPRERDIKNLDIPMTTLIRGDIYENPGRWQPISLGRPLKLAKEQQQLLQAELKRPVNFTDAYVDALLLNVHAGPGPVEIFIDDLDIGPVLNDPTGNNGAVKATPVAKPTPVAPGRSEVEFNGANLHVGGRPFFMRGIRITDTPVKILHAAGFNTIFVDVNADPAIAKEAAALGMRIVPQLPIISEDPRYASAEGLTREVQRLSELDGVLFWHLGRTLSYEQANTIARAAQIIRQADPGRPLGADVWDGLRAHSQTLNLLAVHRWPLMTSLEMPRYREWLEMRRRLMNPGAFTWTWVQTHVPDWNTQLLYGQSGLVNFATPVGPQPEQIRLLTYAALAAGNKGIAFWSDRFLADSHFGRDRLLECALLNQEMEMLEPILSSVDEAPQWIDTSNPDVKAAVLRTNKGILVLPMWQGKGAQFVPGQGAVSKLTFVVPQVPGSMQPWEVLPGDVRQLRMKRVVGGMEIVVPEFGLTTAIVFTSDTNMVIRFQEETRRRRQQAAEWSYALASYNLDKILKVEDELERAGHILPDGAHLISDAKTRLSEAKKRWDTKVYTDAYHEAQRALRPARILMRGQWELAIKGLDAPVSSPFALSFYTLPKHWEMMNEVNASVAGANVLVGGDFESVPENPQDRWKIEEPTLDDVELLPIRVTEVQGPLAMKPVGAPSAIEPPKEGKQCVLLQVRPKKRETAPLVLERTLLQLSSPPARLPAGTLVRISGWVRIPEPIVASQDGVLFYDSAGGEPLAIRLHDATAWKKLTLYRRVPESGQISVMLALTGLGSVYFDDVRVEPLSPSTSVPAKVVSSPK